MYKKTFNLLVATIIFVIPIVCGVQLNETVETTEETIPTKCTERFRGIIMGECRFDATEVKVHMESTWRNFDETFAQQCKNVSGVDIDLERNDRLYEEYVKCVKDLVDPKQFNRELGTLMRDLSVTVEVNTSFSDQQNSAILASVEKYCPVVSNVVRCDDKLQPIYIECIGDWRSDRFWRSEKFLQHIIWVSIFDFFCGKDAENAITFVNEKFIDVILINTRNTTDMKECAKKFEELTPLKRGDPDFFWKMMQDYTNCLNQKIEKWPSSEAFRTFAATALTYIQNACGILSNVTGYPVLPKL